MSPPIKPPSTCICGRKLVRKVLERTMGGYSNVMYICPIRIDNQKNPVIAANHDAIGPLLESTEDNYWPISERTK